MLPDLKTETAQDRGVYARRALGLLDEEDTAALLGLKSIDTLATWRHQKSGPPYVKLGKRVFYTLPLIQKWIDVVYKAQNEIALQGVEVPEVQDAAA